jgi:ABC-2 type transport system permease protein
MFQWMPILLIFLLSALTMRQWSEEQRSGTLEVLLTLPVDLFKLVLGKFFAVMILIAIALLLTLPLPLTVSTIGALDWGPVVGGYLAALLMASAYAAIGLFVSSRTDNQIVALITTVLLGGLFYFVGTSEVTDFVGGPVSELLWAIGTGSRFESIERGVIAFNLVLLNVWLFPLNGIRIDLTAQKEYTISQTTKDLIENLQEPLLIRGYLSEKTHPLLKPLIPNVRDMLREYEIASHGLLTAEVLDPITDPEIEAEANQAYGIRPTPFQIAGRHEASVINSYFDILIRYGDQNVVLNFGDLIEVEQHANSIDVRLRNLEYDLTRAIKKVVFGFQSVDAVLTELSQPVKLTLFVTPDALPEWLIETYAVISEVANGIQSNSNGKLTFEVINPDSPNSPVDRQRLLEVFGVQAIPAAFFSPETYYLHLLLENEGEMQWVYPTGELTEAEVRAEIESALKQTSTGFLKTVGLWTPPDVPTQDMFGQMQQPLSSYRMIQEQLGQEYTVQPVDLSTGQPPSNIDVLVIVAPQDLEDEALYAIDQYLMRGGSVVIATSNYKIVPDQYSGTLMLQPISNRLNELLNTYGITVTSSLVMDLQSDAFPVTVARNVGGIQVQEIQAVDYPFFIDIRPEGMDLESLIVSNLPAVTMNWASPIELNLEKNDQLN